MEKKEMVMPGRISNLPQQLGWDGFQIRSIIEDNKNQKI
jgi:hypothetical protein